MITKRSEVVFCLDTPSDQDHEERKPPSPEPLQSLQFTRKAMACGTASNPEEILINCHLFLGIRQELVTERIYKNRRRTVKSEQPVCNQFISNRS